MTFTCYQTSGLGPGDEILASSMGIDLGTGRVTNFSNAPGTYNECEGIFPDGRYTCVEGDRQVAQLGGNHGSHNIDIYKLRLDGTGKDFVRRQTSTTTKAEGIKSSRSTDGKFMVFRVAHTADEAGVGYGIVLYHF
jgi:hypothetical protein